MLYSLSLGASIVTAAVAVLVGIGGLRTLATVPSRARTLAVASLGLSILSSTVHLAFGHRPGTEQGLGFAPFVREHPTLAIVATVSLVLSLSFRR